MNGGISLDLRSTSSTAPHRSLCRIVAALVPVAGLLLMSSPSWAQTFEATASFIMTEGKVNPDQMRFNDDLSVDIPEYVTAALNKMPLVTMPSSKLITVNRENCDVDLTLHATSQSPEKLFHVHFNRVYNVSMQDLPTDIGPHKKISLVGETPVVCFESRGPALSPMGIPMPQNSCMNAFPLSVKSEDAERVTDAIKYLYSKYCKLSVKKSAF